MVLSLRDVIHERPHWYFITADKGHDDDEDYDEDPVLVARGVKYFMDNIFSFFVCMLAGLLGLMFLPGAVRVLALTNKSDNPLRVCQIKNLLIVNRFFRSYLLKQNVWYIIIVTNKHFSFLCNKILRSNHSNNTSGEVADEIFPFNIGHVRKVSRIIRIVP